LADEYQALSGKVETAWNTARERAFKDPIRFPPDYVESLHTRLTKLATTVRKYAEHQPAGTHWGGPPHPKCVLEELREQLVAAAVVFEEWLSLLDEAVARAHQPPEPTRFGFQHLPSNRRS
jgi:hypothetical protein